MKLFSAFMSLKADMKLSAIQGCNRNRNGAHMIIFAETGIDCSQPYYKTR